MLAGEFYGRARGGVMPRVFVDVTAPLMLCGEQPIGNSRVEAEIARRLLLFSNLNSIPVVFWNDGLLFALSPEQVALIFSSGPLADRQNIRLPKRVSAASSAKSGVAVTAKESSVQEWKPHLQPRPLPIRLRLRVTAALRYATRTLIARMPQTVREDVRAILIHSRRIVRTIIYGHPESVVNSAPVAVPTHPESAAASAPVAITAHSMLPTLRTVVHPCSGDVLWTAGLYSDLVPLRAIGEMRARTGLRVVTTCFDLTRIIHPQFNQPNLSAELFTAGTVALLDASDLILAVSEWTQGELLAFAARSGREPPAVQVLPISSGLSQLFGPDEDESWKTAIAQDAVPLMLEAALWEPRLWDEVAAVIKERLQLLLAKTDSD